jgi:hypothetical protein
MHLLPAGVEFSGDQVKWVLEAAVGVACLSGA